MDSLRTAEDLDGIEDPVTDELVRLDEVRVDIEDAHAEGGLVRDLSQGEWLLNPGGVGQPRDRDERAAWLLLDTGEWSAQWRRVEYPIDAAASAILKAGLPEDLAQRLYHGL